MTASDEMRDIGNRFGPAYDELITPFTTIMGEDAVRRAGVSEGTRLLDVAAGGGALSIPAARAGARVLATDISPVLLERLDARAKAAGLSVETRVMDGNALDLEDGTFDVAASQLGIMLFPERARALKELARVTKPGGKGLMVVFGRPPRVELFFLFMQAMRAAIPDFSPPPDSPLFRLQDPEKLRQEMTDAGFRDLQVDVVDHGFEIASGEQWWTMLTSGAPPVEQMVSRLSEEQRSAVRGALEGMVSERAENGIATFNMQVNVGIGVR